MSIFNAISEKRNLPRPLLYGISNRKLQPALSTRAYLQALFSTNAHLLQWREKDLEKDLQQEIAGAGVVLARQTGKLFLLNSLTEIALEAGTDGVHLTSKQPLEPSLSLRKKWGRQSNFLIGKSVHTLAEALAAEQDGADYLLLGPVFDPISKSSDRAPMGLPGLREVAYMLYIPAFALGGVTQDHIQVIEATSVVGVAGISWLNDEVNQLLRDRGPEKE